MPNYKKLYHKAFNALTDADRLIQQACVMIQTAQQECENIFIETNEDSIYLAREQDSGK